MNKGTEILGKTLTNPNSKAHEKELYYSQVAFILGSRMVQHMLINQGTTSTLTERKTKPHDHSVDAGKAFDKIQYSFMIKSTQQTGIGGTYINTTKAI